MTMADPIVRTNIFLPEPDVTGQTQSARQLAGLSGHSILDQLCARLSHKGPPRFVADPKSLDELLSFSEQAGAIPKNAVFDDTMGAEELEAIRKNVEQQQKQYMDYQRREMERKVAKIREMFEYLTAEEVVFALNQFVPDEEALQLELTKPEFLLKVRKGVALLYEAIHQERELSAQQMKAYEELVSRRKKAGTKTTDAETRKKMARYEGRLKLDDAIAQLSDHIDLEKAMAGWSSARIRAFKCLKDNPNAYYYRFNAPGEAQRNGAWSPKEHEMFMRRLQEIGADGQWGIFAMKIAGRVGYQCANYYRKLIESGQATDPNYVIDKNGKAHYVFGTKKISDLLEGDADVCAHQPNRKRRGASSRKAARSSSEPEAVSSESESDATSIELVSDEDESYVRKQRRRSIVDDMPSPRGSDENPLPGFIDAITLAEVSRPAISPYGHVLSYDTWLKCLCSSERKNVCPLTKQPLQKRQLVVLTPDNIELYRDRMIVLK